MTTTTSVLHILKRHNFYNVFVVFFMSLGTLSYGYGASIVSTTLGQPSFLSYMGIDTASNGTQLEGATTALYYAGAIFGTFTGSFLADRWGRKSPIWTSTIIMIISGALCTGSVNIGMFITFRFFNGFGGYMMVASVSLWITELVPPKSRGWLVDMVAISTVLGFVIASWVGYGFFFYHGNGNEWRPPLSFQLAPAIVLLCGLKWMPESPRWLISKDRNEEAWNILKRLHAQPDDPDDLYPRTELLQIRKQRELDSKLESSYLSLLTYAPYRKRLIIGFLWIFFNQSSGDLVVVNYAPTIYRLLGYGPAKQLLFSSAYLTLIWGCNVVSAFTIDLLPRNRYAAIGLFGCLSCLSIEAALVAKFVGVATVNAAALQAATFAIFLFAVVYGTFMEGVLFVFIGEIYPTHLRSKGVNLSLGFHALTNIIWTTPAATGFKNIGWKYYLPLICVSTIGVLTLWFFFPDTRRIPLEEIAKMFGDEKMVAVYQKDLTNLELKEESFAATQHIEMTGKELA